MKSVLLTSAVAAVSLLALTGGAAAQSMATATTDLNIRSGPGPDFEVVGVIGADEEATVEGCLAESKWCRVSHDGIEGWSYSDYLTSSFGDSGTTIVVTERPAEALPVVTFESPRTVTTTTTTTTAADDDADGALTGATTGAIAGALIGGPVGAAVGGAAGALAGSTLDAVSPPERVVTYVRENQIDPVYLDGEVVVGAALPETVEVREIPDYDYNYVYVNRQPVLVEPESRTIVYVLR